MTVFHSRFLLCLPTCFVVAFLAGCTDSTPSNDSSPTTPEAAETVPTEPPAIAATLEDAGFTVKVSGSSVREISFTDDADLTVLLESLSALPELSSLKAAGSPLTDDAVTAVCEACPRLVNLDLRNCSIGTASLKAAAALPSLKALRLSGQDGSTYLSDDDFALLAECSTLKVLAADFLFISVDSLGPLCKACPLEELYLKGTLTDDDALAAIGTLTKLRYLRLAQTQITDAGLAHLEACKTLADLDLSENSLLTDAALPHIGALTSLKKLNLWRCNVSDTGIAELASLSNLVSLNLDNTQLSDAGVSALSGLNKLEFLHLGSTQITDEAIPLLTKLTALKDFIVTRTAVTEAGRDVLLQSLPDVKVQLIYVPEL